MVRDTQQEAWGALNPKIGERQAVVLSELQRGPATLFELTERLMLPVNRVSGRITELHDKGMIADTGTRRINPQSGKRGIVWAVSSGLGAAAK